MTREPMAELPGPGLTFATTGVEVARSGDMAYEYGTYDFTTEDKKGKIIDEKGKLWSCGRSRPMDRGR